MVYLINNYLRRPHYFFTMNKLTLIAIFSLFCFLNVCGTNISHQIQGRVADKMNGGAIPAKIYLMNTDSTVIDTTTATVEEAQFPFQDKQHPKLICK